MNDTSRTLGDWRTQTDLVRGGHMRSEFHETAEAIYMTSGYVYGSAEEAEAAFKGEVSRYIYSRYANPTVAMFEERLRRLEGAEACFATSSGMAAVFASMMCQLKAGDRVVASRVLFGSCRHIITQILPRFGIEAELVDGPDLAAWEQALSRPTACVFVETPANPTLELVDLEAVCTLAHKAGASVIVDNVFATPLLQKPLAFGADVVVYSATKHIDGQGRCLGGAVLGCESFINDTLQPFMRHTGPALSPFNAWVLLKGLETLALRLDRHCANARELATFLAGQPGVSGVRYPGFEGSPQVELARKQMSQGGSVVAFELDGGKEHAFRMLNALRLVDISNNLGDAKSLVTHPATTTHQRFSPEDRAAAGIGDGLVRLSVGLEDVEDLKADLKQALAA
ncbi:O-succinylhomoserine sulfhydrylase [Ferruginivarius sediminum]|uniref:O-succinylhomoserine sulfhydrylase n=1 Tax=Ferruginivarius sediminum TaxID=2661937 RepID=A0A369T936_9PROT|nr:O-succinylhomoserine sulfhydrylase [Ferruginivarius sediminum]RDD61810.1 O-succinylhomoserine sulfhydrylase [Ferruginivarius sediminum]